MLNDEPNTRRKQDNFSPLQQQQQQQQQLPVRSRLRGVWGDPKVGNLILVSITTHKEADSNDPQKKFLRKSFGS